ncbi:MAG: sulfotransferase family protein [Caldilineaceae bacterium]|nr:sulfotransferase family protein [Caldilineaceae bacterium]
MLQTLRSLIHKKAPAASQSVIIVSGLPRSGTSMMMKMLEAGGLPVFIDGIRTADSDNPKGYYELERVKQLDKGDTAWVADARGKVVKVISALLTYLPPEHEYYILFMRRDLNEILASQKKMLHNRGEEKGADDEEIAALFQQHLTATMDWLADRPNMHLLEVDYNALLQDPEPWLDQVATFVPAALDANAMRAITEPDLYRNRSGQNVSP